MYAVQLFQLEASQERGEKRDAWLPISPQQGEVGKLDQGAKFLLALF